MNWSYKYKEDRRGRWVKWIGALCHFSTIFGYVYGSQFPQLEEYIVRGSEPSVSNWQLPLMGFEPQRRGASSFKARRLNHSAMEAPIMKQVIELILTTLDLCGLWGTVVNEEGGNRRTWRKPTCTHRQPLYPNIYSLTRIKPRFTHRWKEVIKKFVK